MTLRVKPILFGACIALGIHVSAAAQGRVLILDDGGGGQAALLAVDPATGATLARAALRGRPSQIRRSPDGSRLLIDEPVSPGPAFKDQRVDHALAIVDATTLNVIGHVGLTGMQQGNALFSADGRRVTLVVDGFRAPNKIVLVNRALVTIDLNSGELAGWVALPKDLDKNVRLFGSPDAGAAIVLRTDDRYGSCNCAAGASATEVRIAFVDLGEPRLTGQLAQDGDLVWADLSPDRKFLILALRSDKTPKKNEPEPPSQVRFIDLSTREGATTVDLKGIAIRGQVALSPARKHLYLLDTTYGRLEVVSLETRAHAGVVAVGGGARYVRDPKGEHVAVLNGAGELRLLGDAEVVATAKVRSSNWSLPQPGDRLHVFGQGGLTILSWPDLQKVGETTMPLAQLRDVRVTRDGKRAFAFDTKAQLLVLDLDAGQLLAALPTAPPPEDKGKKFAKFAMGVAANRGGPPPPRAPDPIGYPTLVLRPDEEFAYVFNPLVRIVLIVEAKTGQIVDKIPAAGHLLTLLPGGRMLAVEDAKVLRLIDTATNKKGDEVGFPPAGNAVAQWVLSSSPPPAPLIMRPLEGGLALVSRGASAFLLAGATGRVVASISGLHSVADILVQP